MKGLVTQARRPLTDADVYSLITSSGCCCKELYDAAQNQSLHERCWLVSKHLLTTCQAVVTCKGIHNEFFGAATDFTWQQQEPPATSYATRECRGFF